MVKRFQADINDIYQYLINIPQISRCSTFLYLGLHTALMGAQARPVAVAAPVAPVAAPITAATPMRYGAFVQASSDGPVVELPKRKDGIRWYLSLRSVG